MDKIVMHLVIYEDKFEAAWDEFIINNAINGTFLQSRNFLNYHPKEKFVDNSFLLFKDDKIVGVVSGCIIVKGG
jgi:hypothetical protein